jgi:hypothetical protein
MPRIKYNVAEVEKRYVTGRESIRTIAADIGIAFSSLAEKSRKEDWAAKRAAYRQMSGEKAVERVADRWANQKAEVVDEMLVVLRLAIRNFYDKLKDTENPPQLNLKDVTLAMNQMLLLLGEPTQRTENRNLGFTFSAELDPELLRRLEELTRGPSAGSSPGTASSYLEGVGPH